MPLATVAREWTRIGVTGFGGPPAHIVLLRRLVVDRRRWMDAHEFEDANAACGLLPGPASTQLAIFCAYRVGGPLGRDRRRTRIRPPRRRARPAALGACSSGTRRRSGFAAPAPAPAPRSLRSPSTPRARCSSRATTACATKRARLARWARYLVAAAAAAALIGPYLVLVLLGCGLVELALQRRPVRRAGPALGAARRPGAARRGGRRPRRALLDRVQGRRPLLRRRLRDHPADAGRRRAHLPLDDQRRIPQRRRARPGHAGPGRRRRSRRSATRRTASPAGCSPPRSPSSPSFSFILLGGERFRRLRESPNARAFLDGAGPAAIGAILGAAIPLTGALRETWQFGVLAAAAIALLALRRSVVETLLAAGRDRRRARARRRADGLAS